MAPRPLTKAQDKSKVQSLRVRFDSFNEGFSNALPSSQPLQRLRDVPGSYRWPILFRVEVNRMRRNKACDFDNRDSAEMYGYMEARIEAMKGRIAELEMDNARLICELEDSGELMSVCA